MPWKLLQWPENCSNGLKIARMGWDSLKWSENRSNDLRIAQMTWESLNWDENRSNVLSRSNDLRIALKLLENRSIGLRIAQMSWESLKWPENQSNGWLNNFSCLKCERFRDKNQTYKLCFLYILYISWPTVFQFKKKFNLMVFLYFVFGLEIPEKCWK